MNPIQALSQCPLTRELYHSDGKGHVQVESVTPEGLASPAELLEEIEATARWPEFFAMVKTKPEGWILNLVPQFPEAKPYATRCFVAFLDLLSSREALILLVQDAPRWCWDAQNAGLINGVMAKVRTLMDQTPQSGLADEIDLILLGDLLAALVETKGQVGAPDGK